MDHVDNFLFKVTCLGSSVIVHHGKGSANHAVDLARLTSPMALTMEGREFNNHLRGKLSFTTHEDPFPRYEDVIEDKGRAVLRVVCVTDVATIKFAHIQGGPAHHMD
ncbi:MAG: hypothetical protein H6Q53_2360 [Deltaproteobacteria bacterium]|nr:hypothetical protein [Deltaproteobacteria bacterium]